MLVRTGGFQLQAYITLLLDGLSQPGMMAAQPENSERLEAELSLLEAMYPSSITYTPKSRELWFKTSPRDDSSTTNSTNNASGGELKLRLPDSYPESGVPTLISARDGVKNDLRDQTRRAIGELNLVEGEEGLDRIIGAFEALLSDLLATSTEDPLSHKTEPTGSATMNGTKVQQQQQQDPMAPKTVIIWLHHLLATSKRKLAITPTLTASTSTPTRTSSSATNKSTTTTSSLSGITKPGYPGIMIFSGASALVDAHVRELKDLNWQAFQVRYDSSEADDGGDEVGESRRRWKFGHDEEEDANTTAATGGTPRETGKIVEVETMAELVKGITRERDREVFLRSVGVK